MTDRVATRARLRPLRHSRHQRVLDGRHDCRHFDAQRARRRSVGHVWRGRWRGAGLDLCRAQPDPDHHGVHPGVGAHSDLARIPVGASLTLR